MIHADFLPLGMEIALRPDDIVLDGDPAPNFRSMAIVAKRLDGSTWDLA